MCVGLVHGESLGPEHADGCASLSRRGKRGHCLWLRHLGHAGGAAHQEGDDAAGMREEELHGRFLTEDRGSLFSVHPIKEELRYAIPFKDPQVTLDYLARFPEGSTVVYADDGEKFGGWPDTYKHVYEEGWLEKFLTAIEAVPTVTFSEMLARKLHLKPLQRKLQLQLNHLENQNLGPNPVPETEPNAKPFKQAA